MEFERTVRGVKVTITADHFTEDRSVGLSLSPEDLFAIDENGLDFELTEDEEVQFATEAVDIWLDQTLHGDYDEI